MTKESIYETYAREICKRCKNKQKCEEEIRLKINNTIRCDNYEKED